MELPEVRFTTTPDGVNIAYQTWGEGETNLVMLPNVPGGIDAMRSSPAVRRLFAYLEPLGSIAMINLRGFGASDTVPLERAGDLNDWCTDVLTVMDTCGMRSATFYTDGGGGHVALEMAARHPERVDALWVNNCWARVEPELVDVTIDLVGTSWGTGAALSTTSMEVANDDPNPLAFTKRIMAPRNVATAIIGRIYGHDLTEIAPTVTVRSVVAFTGDLPPTTREDCEGLANLLPNAEFIDISEQSQYYVPVEPEAVTALEQFLVGHTVSRSEQRLSTVVFTDIIDSTRKAAAVGDTGWRKILTRLDDATRRVSGARNGRVVKQTGDGHLILVDSPLDAIKLARALHDETRGLGVDLRVGVHTGTLVDHGDDVVGIAVHTAARVMAHAGPGEVVVSRTVSDLVAGSGLEFEDRGIHELRGVPGQWQLFAVVH